LRIAERNYRLRTKDRGRLKRWRDRKGLRIMVRQIRDRNGRLIGLIKDIDNRIEIRNEKGQLKGFYFKSLNQTRNKDGKLIAFGNVLTTLL
jgi:hypothetical protein